MILCSDVHNAFGEYLLNILLYFSVLLAKGLNQVRQVLDIHLGKMSPEKTLNGGV